MTPKAWFEREKSLREMTSTDLYAEMSSAMGVSTTTLKAVIYGGMKLRRREKAEAFSKHTGGVVTVKELCE